MTWRKAGYIAGGLFLAGGLLLLYRFNPSTTAVFMPCPFYATTGYYCPGCGSLRGVHSLLHGNIMAAIRLNPLMVVSIPFLAAFIIKPKLAARKWVPWLALSILITYGILRNIPVEPFSLLAPH